MKKPNITEGEWNIIEGSHEDWRDIYATDAPINSGDIICQDVHKRNAKPIRAVPDMIDVLMQVLEDRKEFGGMVSNKTSKEIKQTLEKAGVEL